MSRIVLVALNARFIHSAFGLRYLLANMGDLQSQTTLLEFVIQDQPLEVVNVIAGHQPEIVGLSVYIWNIEQMTRLARDLRQVLPNCRIVIGGPEVSYDLAGLELAELADFVVQGEGDLVFPELCRNILGNSPPADKVLAAPVPDLSKIKLPYDLYSEQDIAHRVIYVEASRGCPFTCEFCLSALDVPVRQFELTQFLDEMQKLLDRGVQQFKFVDRTFNLNLRISQTILQFFLDRFRPGLFLHFELIPDRLPDGLKSLVRQFPAGSLQFEIGIQTFNDLTGSLISRHQDNQQLEDNLRFLREQTGVHIHSDLIVGLPGEDLQSFGAGFDRLFRLRPHEIQVGILKRLKGTPIVRHDDEWKMVYSRNPPYEILSNRSLKFEDLQRLRTFARFWDLIGNSGNFASTLEFWLSESASPFYELLRLSEWIYAEQQRRHGIALSRLYELVFHYLTNNCDLPGESVAAVIWSDYQRQGRRDCPAFLTTYSLPRAKPERTESNSGTKGQLPGRQSRHLRDQESSP